MTRLIRAGGACDIGEKEGGFAFLNVNSIRFSGLSTNCCLLVTTVTYALGCFYTTLLLFYINTDSEGGIRTNLIWITNSVIGAIP